MKKRIIVIAICVAFSFLVSIGAVSTSFSKQAVQTVPKSQQQQSPTVQEKEHVVQAPNDKFWDLEVDRIEVKGQIIKKGGGHHTIHVKVGETVTFHCYYKMKTIPVRDITKADANYWGSGNLQFKVRFRVGSTTYSIEPKISYKNKNLPHFTWEDVKKWQRSIRSPGSKTWTDEVSFSWTPGAEYVEAYITVEYYLDYDHVIPETHEGNNIMSIMSLLTIIVTP